MQGRHSALCVITARSVSTTSVVPTVWPRILRDDQRHLSRVYITAGGIVVRTSKRRCRSACKVGEIQRRPSVSGLIEREPRPRARITGGVVSLYGSPAPPVPTSNLKEDGCGIMYAKVTVYAFRGKGGRRREAHVSNMHRHLKRILVWRVLTRYRNVDTS